MFFQANWASGGHCTHCRIDDFFSGFLFAHAKEKKHQIIKEMGYDERDTCDIFSTTPSIYTESRRIEDAFLIELWMARTKQTARLVSWDSYLAHEMAAKYQEVWDR